MIVWFEDQNLLNIYIYIYEIHPLNLIEWSLSAKGIKGYVLIDSTHGRMYNVSGLGGK